MFVVADAGPKSGIQFLCNDLRLQMICRIKSGNEF
jgi:hypothetical protein